MAKKNAVKSVSTNRTLDDAFTVRRMAWAELEKQFKVLQKDWTSDKPSNATVRKMDLPARKWGLSLVATVLNTKQKQASPAKKAAPKKGEPTALTDSVPSGE